ncbi:pirin family protein [Leptospira gomenensis]|uniref:Pirin family protein n=1 Tax=Leptospira gomenensis TaxID=2484974 RepID=A0A5F1YZW4_9LEPT|nr:pirin family protein [Leptospira gomenensis]TGK31030.1 pirin family protein [Leptospira gomenensis]TGK43235.1 pirin family protein [Leptospira gomenensis]TGK45250.1 pirin family protein [Leptospira gomenensis]TGK66165.1 pirin family protein [Leptospira gomenensis]
METIYHAQGTRGKADFGWLKSRHSFSFGSYFDPNRIQFGKLRVLNDDIVLGGKGFPPHPHENMEIVSIPLYGSLEHKDSEGNHSVIRPGEVQIMSAGTGIVHSEFNASPSEEVNFLQIWILPERTGIVPRYEQKRFDPSQRHGRFQTVVSPNSEDGAVWINQKVSFSLAIGKRTSKIDYIPKNENGGVYFFLISGSAEIDGKKISARDGLGLLSSPKIEVSFSEDSEILAIDTPL